MIYRLKNGKTIDTAKELTFDERNFMQKMMIYKHLKMDLKTFRGKWQTRENPIWKGKQTLENPTNAVLILLDMEKDFT